MFHPLLYHASFNSVISDVFVFLSVKTVTITLATVFVHSRINFLIASSVAILRIQFIAYTKNTKYNCSHH